MKKDFKAWAVKIQGYGFHYLYQDSYDIPILYPTRREAMDEVERLADLKTMNVRNKNLKAEAVRVNVRVGERT